MHRFGDAPSRDFFLEVLRGERQALDGLIVLAKKLDMSMGDLAYYDVCAKGIAYTTFMAWQALYATPAEFAAGILVNFPAWGHNCGRMSTALRKSYGFTEKDTAFLDGFANMPPLDAAAMVIVQDGLEQGVEPAQIHRGARLFQAFEMMLRRKGRRDRREQDDWVHKSKALLSHMCNQARCTPVPKPSLWP